MKKFLLLTLLVSLLFWQEPVHGQTPLGINYQGVARSVDGSPLINQFVGLRISITSGPNGTNDYIEEHHPETNEFGLFAIIIGQGQSSGNLNDVDWSQGNKWLQIEMDPNDMGDYLLVGSQQLMSVPYALYAANSATGLSSGFGIEITNGQINNVLPDQPITLNGTGAASVTGSYPNFTIDATDNVDDADADPTNEIQSLNQVLAEGADAGNVNITNLAEPVLAQDAATKNYVDTENALDLDKDAMNELIIAGSYEANNTLRITDAGGDTDIALGTLNDNLDADSYKITNIGDPVDPGDAVNLGFLENKDATDYAFKSIINDVGTGVPLTFDLSLLVVFDEGSIIFGTQILISETGIYLFKVKGTALNNAPIVVNINGLINHPVSVINFPIYSEILLLKLSAGDVVELRATSTTNLEVFTFEFFGYKI